jgi:hypothetical protein
MSGMRTAFSNEFHGDESFKWILMKTASLNELNGDGFSKGLNGNRLFSTGLNENGLFQSVK